MTYLVGLDRPLEGCSLKGLVTVWDLFCVLVFGAEVVITQTYGPILLSCYLFHLSPCACFRLFNHDSYFLTHTVPT